MTGKYSHILQPIQIGNTVLKNRLIYSRAYPGFLMASDGSLTDKEMAFFVGIAKNGAGVVTIRDSKRFGEAAKKQPNLPGWNLNDSNVQNRIMQLTGSIHMHGAKVNLGLLAAAPNGYNISDMAGKPNPFAGDPYSKGDAPPAKEMTLEMIEEIIAAAVEKCLFYQSLGADMCNLHVAYNRSFLASSLSPVLNTRTDKYGGSLENRGRLVLDMAQAIKKACGKDFIIEAQISGEEDIPGGFTTEDLIEYARMWEGAVDILQLRGADMELAHPSTFNADIKKPLTLKYAEAIKQSGVKILTAPIGGYQDPELIEEFIASGKTDMVAMARGFIADPEYGKKLYAGRGEDVVPCIQCNNCHGFSRNCKKHTVCSVNPLHGLTPLRETSPIVPEKQLRVAVVGGGPAGMRAASLLSAQGHQVELFEKHSVLGGQLIHAEHAAFKAPLKAFNDYLIRQLDSTGVTVHLGTEATPELIDSMGFDAVIAAVGAVPNIPAIDGLSGDIWTPLNVFGQEEKLGKNVVVIGGGEIGVETAMYLADNGHNVTVLTRQDKLAHDVTTSHYEQHMRDYYSALPNFSFVTKATTTAVTGHSVTYTDAQGGSVTLSCDSVVLSAGLKPDTAAALSFYGSAPRFHMIGDCTNVANVHECMRAAYGLTVSEL